jgi:hypothetical protein
MRGYMPIPSLHVSDVEGTLELGWKRGLTDCKSVDEQLGPRRLLSRLRCGGGGGSTLLPFLFTVNDRESGGSAGSLRDGSGSQIR